MKLTRESLGLNSNLFGSDSPAVANIDFGIGWLYSAQKAYEKSHKAFEEGNRIVVERLSKDWSLSGLDVSAVRYRPFNSEYGFIGEIQSGSRINLTDETAKIQLADKLFQAAQWANIADSAYSIGSMAARGAAEDLALGAKIRKRQDLALAMSTAQKSLIGLFASANPQETSISHEISIEQKKLDELKNASAVLDLELHTTSARFMLLADPSALSVANVQSYLKDDEALVDFFVTSSHRNLPGETYIWVITKSKVHLFASPIDDNALLKFVRTLRCGLDRTLWEQLDSACANLTETSLDERAPLPFRMDLAYALYWQLFGAIQADIAERKLLIITPRSLATVPLEVLPTDWPDFNTKRFADDYTGVKWLIKEHEISVLPSVNSLRLLRSLRHSRPATLPFVGSVPPPYKETVPARKIRKTPYVRRSLRRLQICNRVVPKNDQVRLSPY